MFDFDYTVADSSEGIVDCFNYALGHIGLLPAPAELIRRTIGLPLEDSLVAVAGEPWRRHAPAFRSHWRRRSDQVMVAGTRLLDQAAASIEALHDAGVLLGIVSTKYRCRIEDVLLRENLHHRFDVLLGGDDVRVPKPDPEGLRLALDRLRLAPSEAIYVGDSVVDGEAAHAAGVPFIGVLTGVTTAAELARWKPRRILPSLAALPTLLAAAAARPESRANGADVLDRPNPPIQQGYSGNRRERGRVLRIDE